MINVPADARYDEKVGVIILTGLGEKAFCSGGDQSIRGDYGGGYQDDSGTHHPNALISNVTCTCPNRLSQRYRVGQSVVVMFFT